jgi:glycosyltransferase involved in cell wall biosynthesis
LHSVLTPSQRPSEVVVVLPCYNAANYLPRALESVLAQTYIDFCICAVDDGSTDKTPDILKRYSGFGLHFRQEHAGPAAARNLGIRMSKSRYVAFLDADDYWLPEKLQRQIALLEQNPGVGLVCSDCATLREGKIGSSYFANGYVPRTGKLFERLTRECFIFTPTVVVRRECLDDVGLFNESLQVSEDFNLWLRIAARWEIAVVPEVLAIRDTRPEGLSLATRVEINLQNGIAALEDVRSVCKGLSGGELHALHKTLSERYYLYGSYLLANGMRDDSRKPLASALRCQPARWQALVKLACSFLPGAAFKTLARLRRSNAVPVQESRSDSENVARAG